MREVAIDYNPETEIDSAKHKSWVNVTDKYHVLTVAPDTDNENSRLLVPEGTDLEKLAKDLEPIKILSN